MKYSEEIYAAYPKKVGRKVALKAIDNALKDEPFDKLLEAAKRFAESVEHKRGTTDWEFVPHPATWFNQGRYDDEKTPKLVSPTSDELWKVKSKPGKYEGR